MKGLADYAKESLGLAVRVGVATGYGGVADGIDTPQFATVLGLMLIDAEAGGAVKHSSKQKGSNMLSHGMGMITKLFGHFRA